MKTILTLLAVVVGLYGSGETAGASSFIYVPLSFKLIRNPSDLSLPMGLTTNQWEADLQLTVAEVNGYLAKFQRGYRYVLVESPVPIGEWYYFPHNPALFWDRSTITNQATEEILQTAYSNQNLYQWRSKALNVFILHKNVYGSSAYCGCPPIEEQRIDYTWAAMQTPFHRNDPGNDTNQFAYHILHETSHFFGLYHTFGGTGCTDDFSSDLVEDTLPDRNCATWNQDAIANSFFGQSYSALLTNSPTAADQVNNVFYNIESYHADYHTDSDRYLKGRQTEGQLDRWAEQANLGRQYVVSGKTWFISVGGTDRPNDGTNGLLHTLPFRTVAWGVQSANPVGGDILLLHSGHYNEQLRITTPVSFRLPRTNVWASIGRP